LEGRSEDQAERRGLPAWALFGGLFLLGALVVLVFVLLSGGGGSSRTADLQTVSFERPEDAGEDPFTEPADVEGPETVEVGGEGGAAPAGADGGSADSSVGSGPYGGSGSDLVCDRELLIESLLAQPERLRAWAEVLDIEPTPKAVGAYIRSLTPVTLSVDTRVTNHTFVDGRALPLQSILAAGTAVLVDKYGRPVVRCRCGNPLLEPIFHREATCSDCPPDYEPPPPCRYKPYRPWYGYPPEYLPPKLRDPYPPGYPRPDRAVKRGPICYVLYPRPPKIEYPPQYQPAPETETYAEPEYTEPAYTEPEHTQPEETEPEYTEPTQAEPSESGDGDPGAAESGEQEPYCNESGPGAFAPGCQGELVYP
jgi:hypothetical protein